MCYLDPNRSTFVRLTAEHRTVTRTGHSIIAITGNVHRTVEVVDGRIKRTLTPFEAFLRRWFDPDLKHRYCGTDYKLVTDPSPFLLDSPGLIGTPIKTLPRVQHRSIPDSVPA
jgi:hypothetical protein